MAEEQGTRTVSLWGQQAGAGFPSLASYIRTGCLRAAALSDRSPFACRAVRMAASACLIDCSDSSALFRGKRFDPGGVRVRQTVPPGCEDGFSWGRNVRCSLICVNRVWRWGCVAQSDRGDTVHMAGMAISGHPILAPLCIPPRWHTMCRTLVMVNS
jgi:hypothetical protein